MGRPSAVRLDRIPAAPLIGSQLRFVATKITATGEALTRALQQGVDQILPEVLRRALERGQAVGASALRMREHSIRELIPGANLTRDLARLILVQVEETKKAVVRTVAGEFKDFLEATDLATELQKVLTSLSLSSGPKCASSRTTAPSEGSDRASRSRPHERDPFVAAPGSAQARSEHHDRRSPRAHRCVLAVPDFLSSAHFTGQRGHRAA